MAQVASSSYVEDIPQIDGRRWVTETFVFDDGSVQQSVYLAGPDQDLNAHLEAMVSAANAQFAADAASGAGL